MTALKIQAYDRRAVFVGLAAYIAAGGPVLRDLFTEDRGGWLDAALLAVIHAAGLRSFYDNSAATCADIRFMSASLSREAEGIEDGRAAVRIAERHEDWAKSLPEEPRDLWPWRLEINGDSRAALLAHCVGLTLNAVSGWERRVDAWAHAESWPRTSTST